MHYIGFSSHLSPMCSGGVTVTIIGVDVDTAVEPILTLFSGSNSARSGVRHSRIALFKPSIYVCTVYRLMYKIDIYKSIYTLFALFIVHLHK